MKLVRPLLVGAICTALGLTVSYLLWRPFPPIQISVYQEMRTDNPKEGFEELVGYTGKLPFFWRDLVYTRDYRMAVLRRLPGRHGLLPSPSVDRYIAIDRRWTEQLFLTVYYEQFEPPVTYQQELLGEYEAFAAAFLEAASARGVKIERVGTPVLTWRRSKSISSILSSNGIAFITAAFAAALSSAYLMRSKKTPNQSLEPTAPSGRGSS